MQHADAIAAEQAQRLSSKAAMREIARADAEVNAEILRISCEIERLSAAEPEPQPEAAEPQQRQRLRVLPAEGSAEFSANKLAWSLDAHGGGSSVGDGERLQLTSSQARQFGSVYENQRRRLGVFGSKDYGAANLTRADRAAWTDADGEPRLREPLPPGMTWVINADGADTDAEGWAFAFQFGGGLTWSNHERGKLSWVRRREWVVGAIAAADAAVPDGWASRLGPVVYLAETAMDAETLVVEVRQARRVGAGIVDAEAEAGSATAEAAAAAAEAGSPTLRGAMRQRSASVEVVDVVPQLCARVRWQRHSFQTELAPHGRDPTWFNADNNLMSRQHFPVSEDDKYRAPLFVVSTNAKAPPGGPPVSLVRVWTEEWVNLKIDQVEFVYADGTTKQYGTPSADQGTAGTMVEHRLDLSLPNEYLICIKTLSTHGKGGKNRGSLAGLVFVTSLGRSWAVGRKVSDVHHDEGQLGVERHGECIVGLRVTQSWEGWLARIDGIETTKISDPADAAAIIAAQATAPDAAGVAPSSPPSPAAASPWSVSVLPAWCAPPPTVLSADADTMLTIELVSPGRNTTFGAVTERSYGSVQIPAETLFGSVGCDGWYTLTASDPNEEASVLHHAFSDDARGDNEGTLGEVRISWCFLAAAVPAALPSSAIPSPSALYRRYTNAQAALGPQAVDGTGFRIEEHALHSWMIGLSHGLCVQESAHKAWCNYNFDTATDESTWRMVEQYGVPATLRVRVWPFITGADKLKRDADAIHSSGGTVYRSLCDRYAAVADADEMKKQIRKDLHRTFPEEATIVNTQRGMDTLERLVGAYAVYNTRVGYCQSMNLIAGHLLLALGCGCGSGWADPLDIEIEESSFWLLRYLAEEIVPHYWAEPDMPGMMHHTDTLNELCQVMLPQTMLHFTDVPMALVGMKWMAPLFGHTLPSATLYALWDRLFCKKGGGADILLCAALTILRGIDADVLRRAPLLALQHSATSIHDTGPFIDAVGSYHRAIKQRDDDAFGRSPHSAAHNLSDMMETEPRCMAALRRLHMEAMKHGWSFSEYQMMRLADPFLVTALSSVTAGARAGAPEACVTLSECEAVVEKMLPGLGLITSSSPGGDRPTGARGGASSLLGYLCVALSRSEPFVYTPGGTAAPSVVTLAQFAHGMHALHAGAAAMPQRLALCFRMLDVNGDGVLQKRNLLAALSTLAPQHFSQLVVASGSGNALTTVEEWVGSVCKHRVLPDGSTEAVGITEPEFVAMVTSGSTALGLLLGELVAQMEWRGALCLGIEL